MKVLSVKETKRLVDRETTRIRKLAAEHGLTLHKARSQFEFGFELRNADGKRVFGDSGKGFCKTLVQCERFLDGLAKEKASPLGGAKKQDQR